MGKKIETILNILQRSAETSIHLMKIISENPYAARYRFHHLLHPDNAPKRFRHNWADLYRERQKFYSLLNKLKREGLIIKEGDSRKSIWRITERGRKHFVKRYKNKRQVELPPKEYVARKQGKALVIATFDIPEKERKKRDWLRACLISFGFSKLQKSVWIGRGGISEEFMDDLRKYKIISYVHIFTIGRSGTIVRKL